MVEPPALPPKTVEGAEGVSPPGGVSRHGGPPPPPPAASAWPRSEALAVDGEGGSSPGEVTAPCGQGWGSPPWAPGRARSTSSSIGPVEAATRSALGAAGVGASAPEADATRTSTPALPPRARAAEPGANVVSKGSGAVGRAPSPVGAPEAGAKPPPSDKAVAGTTPPLPSSGRQEHTRTRARQRMQKPLPTWKCKPQVLHQTCGSDVAGAPATRLGLAARPM